MTAQEAKEKTQESLNALNEKKKVLFVKVLESLIKKVDESIMYAISLGKYEINQNFSIELIELEHSEISKWTIGEYENLAAGIAKYLKENGYIFEVKPDFINYINVSVSWSK